jgi:hypothetical protein
MKDLLTLFAAILGFFGCYAVTASLIAAVWCLKYIDVVQSPPFIFFGSMFALFAGFLAGDAVQKAEL